MTTQLINARRAAALLPLYYVAFWIFYSVGFILIALFLPPYWIAQGLSRIHAWQIARAARLWEYIQALNKNS